MSGLDEEQLGELEYRVAELLEEQWDKGTGRPRELTLREALVVTQGYFKIAVRSLLVTLGSHACGSSVCAIGHRR